MSELTEKHCLACEAGIPPMREDAIKEHLSQLTDWQLNAEGTIITRVFDFTNFSKTMAFVNAVAWIAQQEKHHPDMEVSYNRCVVNYSTHAIMGLTENDFICAAKVDALFS